MNDIVLFPQITSLVDIIIFSTVIVFLFNKKLQAVDIVSHIGLFLSWCVVEYVISQMFSNFPWLNLTLFMVLHILICAIHKLAWKHGLIMLLCYSAIAMFAETLVMAYLEYNYKLNYRFLPNSFIIAGAMLSYVLKIFFSLCSILVYKKKLEKYEKIPFTTLIYLLAASLLSIIWFGVTMVVIPGDFRMLLLNSIGIFLFNIVVYFLTFFLAKALKESMKLDAANATIRAELSNAKNVSINLSELKKIRHDLKNVLLVVNAHLTSGNIKDAISYIEKYQGKISKDIKVFSNNSLINYFLSEKYSYAVKNGVEVKFKISQNLKVDEEILAIILANLLDNSIEACLRKKSGCKRVTLLLTDKNNKLLINVENTFDADEIKLNKSFGEGLGIKNVKRLVTEKNGIYHTEIQDNLYKTSIILFNQGGVSL